MNPFPMSGYDGPETFCDRHEELERLIRATTNGVNVTMVALRRMGKSALIRHFFHSRSRKAVCLYVDLQPTSGIEGFCEALATTMAAEMYGRGTKMAVALKDFIRSIGASLTIASDGRPSITLRTGAVQRVGETTLDSLMRALEAHEKPVIVAFDEFQQIGTYPEKNVEGMLRAHIQRMKKTRFIFSGSNREMLNGMFADHRRPFYQSTEHLHLGSIDRETYATFICDRFADARRTIDADAAQYIQDLAERRTFHIQQIAHRLYSGGERRVTMTMVDAAHRNILKEQEYLYFGFRSLLTEAQWGLLIALAHGRIVDAPLSKRFAQDYGLGAASTVSRSLQALVDKELIYRDPDGYRVEDPFLAGWIRMTFPR